MLFIFDLVLITYLTGYIPFLFFFYTSFKSHVEPNWPVMASPSLYALAFVKMKWEDMKWINKTLVFWFVLFLLAMSLLFFPKHEKLKKLKLFEANKYNKVLEFAKKHQPVLPFNYQMTSYLSFQLKQSLCKFPNYGRMVFYNFKKSCQSLPDHFYYIVTTDFIPPIEKDYPDYKVLRQENIDETHIVLEVQKK